MLHVMHNNSIEIKMTISAHVYEMIQVGTLQHGPDTMPPLNGESLTNNSYLQDV